MRCAVVAPPRCLFVLAVRLRTAFFLGPGSGPPQFLGPAPLWSERRAAREPPLGSGSQFLDCFFISKHALYKTKRILAYSKAH
jgi:hypothetical protein